MNERQLSAAERREFSQEWESVRNAIRHCLWKNGVMQRGIGDMPITCENRDKMYKKNPDIKYYVVEWREREDKEPRRLEFKILTKAVDFFNSLQGTLYKSFWARYN